MSEVENLNTIKTLDRSPFKYMVATIGNLPTSFVESMSYYECIAWLVKYLETEVIPTVNNNAEAVAELQAAYIQLKEFVETYFDNLDVQEEINNKLDEMVEDGTLYRLLIARDFANIEELYFKTLFVTSKFIDGPEGMNGGCVLPDNSIIQCSGKNTFFHYAPDGTVLMSNTIPDTGHCNGCCYNPKTGKVYIVGSSGDLTNHIMILNPTTLELEDTIDVTDKEYPASPYGIVYNADKDEYIMARWWGNENPRTIWRTDSEFNLLQVADTGFNDINSTSNIGKFGNYVGVNNMYTHQVMLFSMDDLSYYKTVKINGLVSDTWVITEEEWFDTRSDGKIMLGFHAGGSANPHTNFGTYIYSIFDPAKNYEQCPIKDTFPPKNEFYYVNHTYTGNDRNGTAAAPFNNIYEALNSSLRTERCTGKVIIRFSNNTETIYTPVFTMNKTYTIWNPDRTINFFGAIAVNSGCTVRIGRPVTLQLLESKIDPFDDGAADICCEGNLKIEGRFQTSNSNQTPIITGYGHFEAPFEDCGIDVESYYGDAKCTGNQLFGVENIVKNCRNTYNMQYMVHEFKGVKGNLHVNESNKYIIPPLSKAIMVTPRVNIGTNGYEVSMLWTPNQYVTYALQDSVEGEVKITISAEGEVKLSPSTTAGTFQRIRIVTL